jgi:hypothetical protein
MSFSSFSVIPPVLFPFVDGFGTTAFVEAAGIANAGNAGFAADEAERAGVPNVKPPNGFPLPLPPDGVAAGACKDTEEKMLLPAGVPAEVSDGFFAENLFVVFRCRKATMVSE